MSLKDITAVVLSTAPYSREWPGLCIHTHISKIRNAADHQAARFDSIKRVDTPYWFWLDDDDELPANYMEVLEACIAADADVAYTDELVIGEDGTETIRRGEHYSSESHIHKPTLIHHLALYKTVPAKAAIARTPRWHYYPEMQLSFEVARTGTAAYVPMIGYHWHRGKTGLHTAPHTVSAIVRTQLLCKEILKESNHGSNDLSR